METKKAKILTRIIREFLKDESELMEKKDDKQLVRERRERAVIIQAQQCNIKFIRESLFPLIGYGQKRGINRAQPISYLTESDYEVKPKNFVVLGWS